MLFCRPSPPGLAKTGFVPGTNWASTGCEIRRKPAFVHEHLGLSLGQTRFVPGTNPGPSQEQPEKKIHVYVPFSCPNNMLITLAGQFASEAKLLVRRSEGWHAERDEI